jgi:hypothetical protein
LNFSLFLKLAFFFEGESGGTRVIQKIFSAKRRSDDATNDDGDITISNGEDGDQADDGGEESPSFYVADDEKSIAIVDLLLESKDKT